MTIYTGRGDDGMTDLRDMTRVSKTSYRIESYGTVDEVNALVGTTQPSGYDDIDTCLVTIQEHLHIMQAELATPESKADDPHMTHQHVDLLEVWIDEFDEEVQPLRHFILPGGSQSGAALHHVRAVSRRAERRVVALAESEPINEQIIIYLNRLSDALFTFARVVNHREGIPEQRPSY